MNKVKKALIFGMPGSGKSTMTSILDGHSEIFNLPHADKKLNLFFDKKIFNYLNTMSQEYYSNALDEKGFIHIKDYFGTKEFKINLMNFLKVLYQQCDYGRVESYAHAGFFPIPQFGGDDFVVPFNFDFDKYHQVIKEKLFNKELKTAEEIWDTFYVSFFEVYTQKPFDYSKTISIMAPNDLEGMEYVLNHFKSAKVIFMNRDFKGLILTATLRRKAGWLKNFETYNMQKDVKGWLKSGYADKLLKDIEYIELLEKKYENRFLTLDLNTLVESYDYTIKKVIRFLDIKEEKVLFSASFLGHRYVSGDYNPISKIGDDPEIYFNREIHDLLDSYASKGLVFQQYALQKKLKHLVKKILLGKR